MAGVMGRVPADDSWSRWTAVEKRFQKAGSRTAAIVGVGGSLGVEVWERGWWVGCLRLEMVDVIGGVRYGWRASEKEGSCDCWWVEDLRGWLGSGFAGGRCEWTFGMVR